MQILHGAWVPQDTDDFVQNGTFYLWVERAQLLQVKPGYKIEHLDAKELDAFLVEDLRIAGNSYVKSIRQHLQTFYHWLPSADGKPLPSPELARWLTLPPPEDPTVEPVCCAITAYPLDNVFKTLKELHFLVCYERNDVQFGQDLLFWLHFSQVLRQVLRKDQYIPALEYRDSSGKGKKASTAAI